MNAQALASQVDMSTITEPMVLMPDECIFLASHNRLAIRFDDEPEPVASAPHLWHKLGYGDSPTNRFAGWAVRCGAKFGVDLLLYAKGPQFGHSKYAVVVVPTASGANKRHGGALPLPDGGARWLRQLNGLSKLLLCYVTLPTPAQTRKLEPSSRTHMPLASLVTFPVYLVSFIWYAIVLSLFAPGTPEKTADGSAMRKAQAGTIPKGSLSALPAGSDAVVPQIKGTEVRCVEVGRWNPGKNRE
ncbi:hypothetical protein BCR44DRAFT_1443117 [Catenaria anguillulae PL171]|uniref:tRNA-intron lyase n=1 Tax=Catenaria anguillulae PL171 TaxID=765915 RepID=A0A1Y2HAN6_9FUNG|nr:hypothetical protein BCR44DRAFT_1443117 [Catenaria anguillulae PL171]